jgi:hypothetical protein
MSIHPSVDFEVQVIQQHGGLCERPEELVGPMLSVVCLLPTLVLRTLTVFDV